MGDHMSWTDLLGYFTGIGVLAPHLDSATLLRTVLLAHFLDALMCRLFAHNNHYPKNLWTLFGFLFGIWAVAIFILLPRREVPRPGEETR